MSVTPRSNQAKTKRMILALIGIAAAVALIFYQPSDTQRMTVLKEGEKQESGPKKAFDG